MLKYAYNGAESDKFWQIPHYYNGGLVGGGDGEGTDCSPVAAIGVEAAKADVTRGDRLDGGPADFILTDKRLCQRSPSLTVCR